MSRFMTVFARFGLFAAKSDVADAFDLRLTRIGTREARARSLGLTFRNQSSRPAGAALS